MRNAIIIVVLTFICNYVKGQCNDTQILNGTQTSQLNVAFSSLQNALYSKNLSQIDSISAAAQIIFSSEAGQPDAQETYSTLSSNSTWLLLNPALTLSRQLIAADSLVYVNIHKTCKGELPPLYQPHSVPLRAGAEVCIGLIRIANAETDLSRRNIYLQWATDGLDSLLTMQLPNGSFPFPDLRPYGDPVFTPIINSYMQSLGADSVNVLINGWIIDDRGTGEFKFDAGVIGGAFAEAYQFTGDTNYRNAALRTAAYCDTLRMNTNYNYNTFQAYALSFGYALAPQNSDWSLNSDTLLRYSVLPGQIPNGRWMDGHNAKSVYHNIIIHNTAAILMNTSASNPHFDTLSGMLNIALRNFLSQYYTCDASVGFDGLLRAWKLGTNIVPQTLHDSIGDVIGNYINRAATDGAFLDVYTMGLYLDAQLNLSSVPESEEIIFFSAFPNPASEMLTLNIENAQEGACVSIYNSLGALVLKLPVQNTFARSVIQISVAEFPAGIYTAVFENENNRNSIIWIKSNQQ
jgi:hypothetical protein